MKDVHNNQQLHFVQSRYFSLDLATQLQMSEKHAKASTDEMLLNGDFEPKHHMWHEGLSLEHPPHVRQECWKSGHHQCQPSSLQRAQVFLHSLRMHRLGPGAAAPLILSWDFLATNIKASTCPFLKGPFKKR